MKNKFQTLLCTLILCTMFFAAFAGKDVQAAAKAPVCPKNQTVYGYVDSKKLIDNLTTYSQYIYIKDLAPDAEFSDFKSSNKNVEMFVDSDMDAVGLDLGPVSLKDGTKSKISFTIKQNGKKYNLSCNVTFKKAKSAFKSLKIGNKEYASTFNGGENFKSANFPDTESAKITYTPAAGFKIKYIQVNYNDFTGKRIKNGDKVNLKNVTGLEIKFGVTKKPTYYSTPNEGNYWGFRRMPLSSETYFLSKRGAYFF